MSIGMKLADAFRKGRLFVIDHEAGIEIGAGIACFAVSVATAAKAALKTKKIMEEYNKEALGIEADKANGCIKAYQDNEEVMVEYTEQGAKHDMAKLKRRTFGRVALAWTPSVLGFAAGTGLVLRSHHVMVKSNLGLAAALKTSETAFEEYRNRVKEKIGEKEEADLYAGEKEVTTKGKKGAPSVTEKVPVDFPISRYGRIMGRDYVERDADWDITSDDYNKNRVKIVERNANMKLRRLGRVTLNEVYESLGLSPTDDGDVVGWRLENYGGKTPIDGINIKVIEHMLKADPNAVSYVHDDWTDSMVKMAEPFFVDFNCEGIIIAPSTLAKIGGKA